jgi:hypothetical protein
MMHREKHGAQSQRNGPRLRLSGHAETKPGERPEQEEAMFDELVQVSTAMQESAGATGLFPALCGCVHCGTRRMIAAPVLGLCETCGSDMQLLGPEPEKREPLRPAA